MFLDASAMVAILAAEAGWEHLAEKVEGSRRLAITHKSGFG